MTAAYHAEPQAFSYHRRSAWPAVVFALALVGAAETAGMHLLLSRWSVAAAWLLTCASVYAVLWLVADARACRRRPILLGDVLLVQVGLRWTVPVPYAAIARATPVAGATSPPRRTPGYLRATAIGAPTLMLELADDVVAEGPYGIRRRVRRLGIAPDDPTGFLAALTQRCPG